MSETDYAKDALRNYYYYSGNAKHCLFMTSRQLDAMRVCEHYVKIDFAFYDFDLCCYLVFLKDFVCTNDSQVFGLGVAVGRVLGGDSLHNVWE